MLDGEPLMDAAEVPLRGMHNLENTMAAALSAWLVGATHPEIRRAVMTFPGVEHRLDSFASATASPGTTIQKRPMSMRP